VRWGAVSQADDRALQSPFRSGIEVDEYQLDPVVRALSMPRVNLLIADDVGLGKTIEAGLVVQEMILRHRVRSVFIVCPSSLQVQWKEEMRAKAELERMPTEEEAEQSHQDTLFDQSCWLWDAMIGETRERVRAYQSQEVSVALAGNLTYVAVRYTN
jgi:SNF2 family DNA or RNA helicase